MSYAMALSWEGGGYIGGQGFSHTGMVGSAVMNLVLKIFIHLGPYFIHLMDPPPFSEKNGLPISHLVLETFILKVTWSNLLPKSEKNYHWKHFVHIFYLMINMINTLVNHLTLG